MNERNLLYRQKEAMYKGTIKTAIKTTLSPQKFMYTCLCLCKEKKKKREMKTKQKKHQKKREGKRMMITGSQIDAIRIFDDDSDDDANADDKEMG